MALPQHKSKPTFDLYREKILLYSDPKHGKTSLVAAMPFDVCFLAAEQGQSKVDAYVVDITSWAVFQEVVAELKEDKKFQMICVDTIDALWYLYLDHFKKINNVDWEGDMKWGKGHALLVRGFVTEFLTLQCTGKGFFLLAHAQNGNGEDSTVRPNLPYDKNNQIRDAICGLCDYILYLRMESGTNDKGEIIQRRVIRTSPSEDYIAGARWPIPDPIPLIEGDAEKSALRIVNAYKKSAPAPATEKQKDEKSKEDKSNGTLGI